MATKCSETMFNIIGHVFDKRVSHYTRNIRNNRFGFIESVHENYWKGQKFSRPLAPAKVVFGFPSELNIPEGPEYVCLF